jgi:hypothetical protein
VPQPNHRVVIFAQGTGGYFTVPTTVLNPPDSHWANVVLLMGFEGVNGSTGAPGMTDESSSAHGTATVVSGASISTSQSKFGSSSLFLNGSGSITLPDSSDFDLGSGPFTIEAFINFTSIPSLTGLEYIVGQIGAGGNIGWVLYGASGDHLALDVTTDGSTRTSVVSTSASFASAGVWYYVAADYDGVKYRGYINGVQSSSFAIPKTVFNSSAVLSIGSDAANGNRFHGYIDELRITKGVARYATDTSFPVPVLPFPRHG